MRSTTVSAMSHLNSLPPEWSTDLLPAIREEIGSSRYKIIILDDDPTGTQTARDLPVLTKWSEQDLREELVREYPAFFILTNSRSLPEDQACSLARDIGTNLRRASEATGVRVVLISRSDSTLRGHFPAEVDAMAEAMGKESLPYLILPFFLEGGRYTINDIHYVRDQDQLIPASQTPFAKDAAFGFSHSNLKEWVEEKTCGKIPASAVTSVTIDDIRRGGPHKVAEILSSVNPGCACIVNAASYRDIEVIVTALLMVEHDGKEFLYRTAASFVRTRTGLDHRAELLSRSELAGDSYHGGLFVIGSYVEKTSLQLEALLAKTRVKSIEVEVEALLDPALRQKEIARAAVEVSEFLAAGQDTVLFTSRKLITGKDPAASLTIGQTVSDSLIAITWAISVQPRYLVAKGGITSSDIATKGLGVCRAMVIGQAQPGVPVWRLGPETRYPGMSYIIFPGNVGEENALACLQKNLEAPPTEENRDAC
ncbi:MAG: hypothetical protein KJ630_15025 [Proteobacteria bacterium]|nr:hypothetical protein [Pseudomonadota bacterium]